MISLEDAERLAIDWVRSKHHDPERAHELVVVEAKIKDDGVTAIISYNSQKLVETGNPRFALAGNLPVLVDLRSGALSHQVSRNSL